MSRELILEWAIFILIGHLPPSCLLSKGWCWCSPLSLRVWSQGHTRGTHPPASHLCPRPPSACSLQTLILKALVLVKVLLRQVRVIFQTWCRFAWSWTGVSGLGNGALRSARLSPQRASAPPGAPDLTAPRLPPKLPGTPNHTANTRLLLPFGIFSYIAPVAREVKRGNIHILSLFS